MSIVQDWEPTTIHVCENCGGVIGLRAEPCANCGRMLRAVEVVPASQLRGAVALLTDGRAFWDAIYPYITEAGPDLNLADCEKITSWLAAHLAGSPDVQR